MVGFNLLLTVSTLSFGAGVLTVVVVGLLIAIYRNTRKKDEDDEAGIYTIPASSLMGMPQGGGGGGMNSLMAMYQAAQDAKAAEGAAEKKDEPKAALGGTYL